MYEILLVGSGIAVGMFIASIGFTNLLEKNGLIMKDGKIVKDKNAVEGE